MSRQLKEALAQVEDIDASNRKDVLRLARVLYNVTEMLKEELRGQRTKYHARGVNSARLLLAEMFEDGFPFPKRPASK